MRCSKNRMHPPWQHMRQDEHFFDRRRAPLPDKEHAQKPILSTAADTDYV